MADSGIPSGSAGGVMARLMVNKVETSLWLTRVMTVFFGLLFLIPFLGGDPVSLYQRIFLTAAATSALRLHQRAARPVSFTREFFGALVLEDSCHYLFFSLIFYHTSPVTLAVLPVALFALLHATTFTLLVLDELGPESVPAIRRLIAAVKLRQLQILRFVACAEIFLFPTAIFAVASGKGGLVTPFLYYRFLTLRYASRRNPYCRTVFYELRMSIEQLCQHPSCPGFLKNMAAHAIATVSRFAPAVATA